MARPHVQTLIGLSFLLILGLVIFIKSDMLGITRAQIHMPIYWRNIIKNMRNEREKDTAEEEDDEKVEKEEKKEDDIDDKEGEEEKAEQINAVMKEMRISDKELVSSFLNVSVDGMSEPEAMAHFYRAVSQPVQGVCYSLKRIGGMWVDLQRSKSVDGDKFICMDEFRTLGSCLIYSFGIRDDWSFEDLMDELNCKTFAYDPTVQYPSKRGKYISFESIGVASENREGYKTLKEIIEMNDHQDETIFYLKVDIEGEELSSFPEWISSGALGNVKQVALEMHLPPIHEQRRFKWLLDLMKQLYQMNFRLISHEINMTVGKPANAGYYSYMELVFMKDDIWSFLDRT